MPTFSRQELYDLIWSQPMRTLAERFELSDVGLRKQCAKAAIPIPPRGYWAKLAAGKPTPAFKLSARDPGASAFVEIGKGGRPYWRAPGLRADEPLGLPPTFDETIEALRERLARRVGKIGSRVDLQSPHSGLRRLLEAEEKRKAKFAQFAWSFDKPIFESPFEKRRLRLLNALATGLSKAGARMEVGGQAGRHISVKVGETFVSLSLDHPKAKPNRQGEWETREGPATELVLKIGRETLDGVQGHWPENTAIRLESKLSAIVLEILVAGEAAYRAQCLFQYQWRVEERERQKAEERQRLEEAERERLARLQAAAKTRRAQLLGQATAFRSAQDIRAFVAQVRATGVAANVDAWAAWALEEADQMDPTLNGALVLPGTVDPDEG